MLMVEDVDLTPNPHALKFILNKKLLNIIKICITLCILYFLFRKVDINQVFANLKNYNLFYLFINFIIF